MNGNDLISFAGGEMTVWGLFFFSWFSLVFFTLAYQMTKDLPQPQRTIKFTIGGVGLSIAVALFMKSVGWWVFE